MNSVLNDFLARFGDKENIDYLTKKHNKITPTVSLSDEDLEDEGGYSEAKGGPSKFRTTANKIIGDATYEEDGVTEKTQGLLGKLGGNESELTQGEGLLATKKMGAGDYAQAAMGAFEIGKSFSGKQFDTSAEGSGPGKVGGHIATGAMKGFQAGMATGNPFIAAGGAIVGGLAPLVSHGKMIKEWRENQKVANLEKDALSSKELANDTAMKNGLQGLEDVKSLRKKQLGILS